MANLQSPGVQVQVIDESFYLPGAPGTTPMIFVASGQDKTNPSGNIAQGTTAENAGKVWVITSQRDLVDTFGTPVFYTDVNSNPLHGGELNEYGLQAAYSLLGVSSRAYVVRAGLDTNQLVPSSSPPVGNPVSGKYWLETDTSKFGVKVWNSSTVSFTSVTPKVLDDTASSTDLVGGVPTAAFGKQGDFAMVLLSTNVNKLYYKSAATTWELVDNSFDTNKVTKISPHYTVPFTTATASGSVWVTSTPQANGADWMVKYFDGLTQNWVDVDAPINLTLAAAIYNFDKTGGGLNTPVGTLTVIPESDTVADFKIYRKSKSGTVTKEISSTAAASTGTYTFTVQESIVNSSVLTSVPLTFTATGGEQLGSLVAGAINASSLTNVSATWASNKLTLTHSKGGLMVLVDGTNTPLGSLGVSGTTVVSNWSLLEYEAKATAPTRTPENGTLWYNSVVDTVDIMVHDGDSWEGYKTIFPNTDSNGPIVSAVQPTAQSNGSTLANGDIWISTADLDRYGRDIYVYNGSKWVLQDVTDQSTPNGWLFADARQATASGATDIPSLLTSNNVDADRPDPALYPKGMRLWNTRRSGFNVKKYVVGHIGGTQDRWVTQYPTAADGGPQFGRLAQRAQVVNALKETIDNNTSVRDIDTLVFNLLATPGYPEAIQNMIVLNTDRKLTAFVVGDSPFRLEPNGTKLTEWALNSKGALDNGDDGAVSYDEYMAMWYPSGYTNDNTGNYIVVPPSHMMLRTIVNSDNKSYQWFAPAGTRRGGVDNVTSVGYITKEGEFKSVALYEGLRDVLYNAKVNPIATLTGVGVVAYGQKTRARNASALDRINVSRLVAYLRRQLDIMARPFLFEPNDAQTRREIKAAAESLLLELVGQRALYDFIVVCDESNNTPSRIDRNELWLDIAIEPVKAIEFIYIPLRLKNTGDIAAGL